MGGGVPGELELYLYVLFHLCLRENNRDRTECKKKGGGQVIMIFLALWEVHIGICYNIFCAFDIFKMFYNLTSL